jgi:AmmeMemoRadiSam system protein A
MKECVHPLTRLAKAAVEAYINEGIVIKTQEFTLEMKEKSGVFICLKKHGQLRGCIGTFEPTRSTVAEEVIYNAVSSATGDPRFTPVKASELKDIDYTVDVLAHPEPVNSKAELDPKKYGVIVEKGSRRGLLLPDLEGVNSVDEQIRICRLKAGISEDEPVKLYRFQVRRYT